jgi:hypothetical protein
MTDPITKLWCHIEGDRDFFGVSISPRHTVDGLKKQIYDEHVRFIVECGSARLSHKGALYHDLYVNINVRDGLCWLMTSAG